MMQVFNEFNARFLENELNLFKGIFTNPIFWGVIVITVVLQAIIVEFGSFFTQVCPLFLCLFCLFVSLFFCTLFFLFSCILIP